ncbi:MAG: aconitate hydratase AcnA [Candidatus Dadabacteria bacterium]|nr:MAG: aconitate hydratase AcnA [Candidatus Dadabacteria bacterium]
MTQDPFNVRRTLDTSSGPVAYYSLPELASRPGFEQVATLPITIRIMLEAALRQLDGFAVTEKDVRYVAGWQQRPDQSDEFPFKVARVVMQDFTGVPAVVDLAVMRDAMADNFDGDAQKINPVLPVDLVIDHSVQIDAWASKEALEQNMKLEFERNRERYEFLKWGAQAFDNFRVVPPGTGIIHQVNLEYLANVVQTRVVDGETVAYPDTLVGTDSHTTMINGLGVLGWGVGGIEAEAALLNQPLYMLLPEVVGFRLTGTLPEGATATDLVLRITQMLREFGVVGKFVEYFGPGLDALSLADRATIANMAPEYGATCGFFPVDDATLAYLRDSGRPDDLVELVEQYCKAQELWRDDSVERRYSDVLELDMGTVEPAISGPKRPQDRIALREAKQAFLDVLPELGPSGNEVSIDVDGKTATLRDGSIVIASITSCTNTSNPSVMLGAGLLARKAVEAGLEVPAHVKTSLAPGSRVVTRYLEHAGLLPSLEQLGYEVVAYGCTTCIGNSGPLRPEISQAIRDNGLVAVSVLSGNRNFEGRIHPDVRANYLASPPLVIAYALAGRIDIDFDDEPIGTGKDGHPVYLRDIWPSNQEIADAVRSAIQRQMFVDEYDEAINRNAMWQAVDAPTGERYDWREESTYIRKAPFFESLSRERRSIEPVSGARVLALLGDSVTTDHISPAGAIPKDSPAAKWLMERGVDPKDFNSYGSRRGNHEVMMRGTFGNIRLRNRLVPGIEGGYTRYLPTGETTSIYDAAMRYRDDGTPLIVIAGKEYGTGSSRDWAAKGTYLLGVRAVIAESFERIHRSNLVGMGVLPLQFVDGVSAESLGLTGEETFDIPNLSDDLQPKQQLTVIAHGANGDVEIPVIVRIDTPVEIDYYRNGGILHTVLLQKAGVA